MAKVKANGEGCSVLSHMVVRLAIACFGVLLVLSMGIHLVGVEDDNRHGHTRWRV